MQQRLVLSITRRERKQTYYRKAIFYTRDHWSSFWGTPIKI